ncbi:MAG: hypothetical protein R3F05_14430 [Planctomycetota bacterium]
MTACALANIEMARYVLRSGKGGREGWDKRPDAADVQPALYDGLAWLNTNWSAFANPQPGVPHDQGGYHIYYLYAIERAMDLFDIRQIDSHSWYSEMGQELLNRQYDDGHWETGSTHKPKDVLDVLRAPLPQARHRRLDRLPPSPTAAAPHVITANVEKHSHSASCEGSSLTEVAAWHLLQRRQRECFDTAKSKALHVKGL